MGFKSFAERISVDFVPGVTAVVGPNGSGKSNITDAIRWVLGEQSAKSLRGAKMEDVIFAGSDSRKPLNFAEVTLVLDNTKGLFPLDYTELSVSRRVFRSGESAYLLNGQQCRLKDINDVFMDSGLGKEAFSIISQGRVDEILNSRPEDRRSIFDEAAGVLKYKTRKKKAEHKLFETEDNLDRVLDILKELDSRILPLQKSAEAAKKHAVLSVETRQADVELLNYDAKKLHDEVVNKTITARESQLEKEKIDVEMEAIEMEVDSLKKKVTQVDEKMDVLQRKLVDTSAEAEKWDGRRLLSMEKRRNSEQQIARIQSEVSAIELEKETLVEKIRIAKENLTLSVKNLDQASSEMDGISKVLKRSVVETEKEIEDLKATYIDRLNEEATLRNDLKHIDERLIGEKSSTEKILEQTSLLKVRLLELTNEKSLKTATLASLRLKYEEANASSHRSIQELRKTEQELHEQQELLQNALNRQYEMNGRMRALESMEADFSGFYTGVKEVLVGKKTGKLSGIDGAVAELITVKKDYIKAIETALGGATQHIVTGSEAEARKAIGYLKTKNAGRATFLPRDIMKSRSIPRGTLQTVEQHPEFIGTAERLVETSPEFAIITENLLGNTVVVKTLAGASAVAKLLGFRYRVVTMDGDVVNAGGSLTGGGAKGGASVFTRKAELETLKSQLGTMQESIRVATEKIKETKMEVARHLHHSEQLRTTTNDLQVEINSSESSVRETDISIKTLESELSTIEVGRRGAESSGSELAVRKSTLQKEHLRVKEDLLTLQGKVAVLERLAADRRSEESALKERFSNLREKVAVLREQKANQLTAISELELAEKTGTQKLNGLREQEMYFAGNEAEKELTADEIVAKIQHATELKRSIEQALSEDRTTRNSLAEQLQKRELHLRTLRVSASEASSRLNTLNVLISRLETQYETVTQRLMNDYGLHPDMQVDEDYDELVGRGRVDALKRELASLGPVNPNAIVEYAEVYERHTFLTTQRNDLLEAKRTLDEAMSEMDTEMITRFSTTFNAVQERFRAVFKVMFGGGDADVILTNPSNLLETGVDIVARPPGKKLQNLSLLSGGERALTAIALLFSIIEVRPVPFCILDEVEAALDEANVLRYSKYLKKFSEKTQFIVITHRKGTMEGADVLYGITMQESGVSKLISVKLSEVPEEAIM